MARSTRRRAESLTGRVPFTTCETVVKDTPARAATCLLVLKGRSPRAAWGNSILASVVRHVVGHLDLAGDDIGFRLVDLLLHLGGDELGVVLVEGVVDAVLLQAQHHEAPLVVLRGVVHRGLEP